MTDHKIIARIRKVLAKAEGTNNAAEAETLMAKVQSMLDEHNLNLLEVGRVDDDPIGTDKNVEHCFVVDSWKSKLGSALARLYGCRVVTFKPRNKTFMSISGRESGRVTWALMLPFVVSQVKAEGKRLYDADQGAMHDGRPAEGRSRNSFNRMVANALTSRVWRMVREAEHADSERIANGSRALAPVDLVEAEMNSAFPSLAKSRSSRLSTTGAARAAAEGISLHRQTGGDDARRIGSGE